MDKNQFFSELRNGNSNLVESFIDSIINYYSSQEIVLSQNCGLYAVGSSLDNSNYNDIDITLVGLDFRNVFTSINDSFFLAPFTRNLFSSLDINYDDYDVKINPFSKYQTAHGNFLGSRVQYGLIDFIIHAENLLVPYWKKHQEDTSLDYVILHEWKDVGVESLAARRIPQGDLSLPYFIDSSGRERSKIFCSGLDEEKYFPI